MTPKLSCITDEQINVLIEVLKDVLGSNESDRPPKWWALFIVVEHHLMFNYYSVLISQWSSFLDIIGKHVRKAGFTSVRIDGR